MVKVAYLVIGSHGFSKFSEVYATFGQAQERATELQFRGYPVQIRKVFVA
jgi:hypothetical protein